MVDQLRRRTPPTSTPRLTFTFWSKVSPRSGTEVAQATRATERRIVPGDGVGGRGPTHPGPESAETRELERAFVRGATGSADVATGLGGLLTT